MKTFCRSKKNVFFGVTSAIVLSLSLPGAMPALAAGPANVLTGGGSGHYSVKECSDFEEQADRTLAPLIKAHDDCMESHGGSGEHVGDVSLGGRCN
jgi:hypothetical protein